MITGFVLGILGTADMETLGSSVVIRTVLNQGVHPKEFVANLWTEFAAHRSEALVTNVKEPQNP